MWWTRSYIEEGINSFTQSIPVEKKPPENQSNSGQANLKQSS